MRGRWMLGALCGAALLLSAREDLAQQCRRSCRPGEVIDGRGCCVSPASPPPPVPPPPARVPPTERLRPTPARQPSLAQDSRCPTGMVFIAGGTSTMGTPPFEGQDDERPQHRVRLSPFCLGRKEVTVAAYRSCVQQGLCATANTGYACNWSVRGREDHPINCIDWNQAKVYCESLGQRLPTEAEWEFAASAGGTGIFPWGDAAPTDRLCWSGDNRRSSTCVVGSFPSGNSPAGISDLSGNVWEWVSDRYSPYQSFDQVNPTGASAGNSRVRRGGSWNDFGPDAVRARVRNGNEPTFWYGHLGVRCASGPR